MYRAHHLALVLTSLRHIEKLDQTARHSQLAASAVKAFMRYVELRVPSSLEQATSDSRHSNKAT